MFEAVVETRRSTLTARPECKKLSKRSGPRAGAGATTATRGGQGAEREPRSNADR